ARRDPERRPVRVSPLRVRPGGAVRPNAVRRTGRDAAGQSRDGPRRREVDPRPGRGGDAQAAPPPGGPRGLRGATSRAPPPVARAHLYAPALRLGPGRLGSHVTRPEKTARRMPPTTAGGRYAIGARLGAGAHKEVYRARDTVLERDVALAFVR